MSETDEAFWENLYDEYVGGWIEEDFSFEDEQGLVVEDGTAIDKLHTSIFNRINEAAKLPQNKDIGYFHNTRKHGMVKNKDKFARIAKEKLKVVVEEGEKRRLVDVVKGLRAPDAKLTAIRNVRVVTEGGVNEFNRIERDLLVAGGKVATVFFRELGRASSKEEVRSIIGRAEGELPKVSLEKVRSAAREREEEL